MGLQGFSNNASGGISPGDTLHAKVINNIAEAADKAQVGPSGGLTFTSTNGGLAVYIPEQVTTDTTGVGMQLYCTVSLYTGTDAVENEWIIQVIKGAVIWSPSTIPPSDSNSTTDQDLIINFYDSGGGDSGDGTIVSGDDTTLISGGGVSFVPEDGSKYGIYIFKAIGVPEDVGPIIVMLKDYTIDYPIDLPFSYPDAVGGEVWQALEVATFTFHQGDPEAEPPTFDHFDINQELIGSLTLPLSQSSSPEPIENTCPSRIFNIHAAGSKYYINVAPFTVNNRQVTDYDDNPLKTGTVYEDIEVFKTGLTTDALRTNYVYVAGDVDNSTPTAPLYPTNAYIVVKETETASDEEFGLTLLGTVTGYINGADVPVLTINNLKGCGSVWTTRYKCGSYYPAVYWWSGV